MNTQRMIQMLAMMLIRPLIGFLMRADPNDQSAQGKDRQARANQMSKGTKQAMRLGRRLSKF